MNAGRPATPDAGSPRCRWCAAPVRLVESCVGWSWVHTGSGYSCRGPGRAVMPTHAEPAPSSPAGGVDGDGQRLTSRATPPLRAARFVGRDD